MATNGIKEVTYRSTRLRLRADFKQRAGCHCGTLAAPVTLDTLSKWRILAPIAICSAATTPGIFFFPIPQSSRETVLHFALPVVAGLAGMLYAALGLRDWLWREEKNRWVGQQIRQEFLKMIPADLGVTPEERVRLDKEEIHNELTGMFWEAIDGYPELAAQKQFFYKNGFLYTSSIDAALILPLIAALYYGLFLLGFGRIHTFFATVCLLVAWVACVLAIPSCRRRHLRLSSEQLDLIRRRRREFVEGRFREIITQWRKTTPPPLPHSSTDTGQA